MRDGQLDISVPDFLRMLRTESTSVNPGGWSPDWEHAPWTVDVREGGTRISLSGDGPLPGELGPALSRSICIHRVRAARPEVETRANPGMRGRPGLVISLRRPVPAGGARYPTDVYLIDGSSGSIWTVDVYRHELVLICSGLAHDAAVQRVTGGTRMALVLTVNFWRTTCKYGEFAYRLTAVDAGVVLGRLRREVEVELQADADVEIDLDFEDEEMARLLGLSVGEAVYGLLTWRPTVGLQLAPGHRPATGRQTRSDTPKGLPPRLFAAHRQATTARLGRAMRPAQQGAAQGGAVLDLSSDSSRRRSSAASMSARSTSRDACMRILVAAHDELVRARARIGSEVSPVRLCCCVVRVEGLEPGWYELDPVNCQLRLRAMDDDAGAHLQDAMLSGSVNAELAAFTVHPTSDAEPWTREGGVRAYRAQQLLVGVVLDALTVAATVEGLGSHIFLGVDARKLDRRYRLPEDIGVQAQVSIGPVHADPVPEIPVR